MATDYTTDYSNNGTGFGFDLGPIHLRVGNSPAANAPANAPAQSSGLVWVILAAAAWLLLK